MKHLYGLSRDGGKTFPMWAGSPELEMMTEKTARSRNAAGLNVGPGWRLELVGTGAQILEWRKAATAHAGGDA